jgi:hypothetical protein
MKCMAAIAIAEGLLAIWIAKEHQSGNQQPCYYITRIIDNGEQTLTETITSNAPIRSAK